MTTKALRDDDEVPAGMRRVCRRFERWRKGHKARMPIPEGLWASAAQAAREHGVFRTAKVLRLEYGPRGCPACRSAWLSWRGHGARCASSGKGPLRRTWQV
jgi:hypothetical protein